MNCVGHIKIHFSNVAGEKSLLQLSRVLETACFIENSSFTSHDSILAVTLIDSSNLISSPSQLRMPQMSPQSFTSIFLCRLFAKASCLALSLILSRSYIVYIGAFFCCSFAAAGPAANLGLTPGQTLTGGPGLIKIPCQASCSASLISFTKSSMYSTTDFSSFGLTCFLNAL